MVESRLIKAPEPGTKQEVYIEPNQAVDLGFDVKNVKVDILGADIVFTFKDGAQLILTNLGISLFSENAPHLNYDGKPITSDDVLSQIGMVQSVSGRDAALLTSMQVDKNATDPVENEVKVIEKVVYKVRDNPPMVINPPPTLEQSTANTTSHGAQVQQEIKKTFDEMLVSRKTEIENNTNIGKYTAPPVDYNPPRIQSLAPVGGAFDLGAPLVFSAKLLQLPPTLSLDSLSNTLTYQGGTGNSAAVLDPSFLTQTQREFVDVTRHAGAAVIYAETDVLVDANLLSRRVEIQPALPVGYELTFLSISGLPAGFTLRGFTPDGNGDYVFTGADLTPGSGPQRFVLQYDPTAFGGAPADLDGDSLAHEYAQFDLVFSTTMFDPRNGAVISDEHTIPVIVKDTTPTDFSYVQDGWVLDTKPNENIIVAGDGGVTVYGSLVVDRISTGTGNDTVQGYGGDDNISTSSGNDTINPGTGNNVVDGGDGTDLLTYDDRNEDISIDLGGTQNIFGEITAYVGPTQEDQVKGIENLTTGSGADTLLGNALANVLTGGAGDDFLMGRGGDDTLAGGLGTDTVSYTYAGVGVTVDLQAGTAAVEAGDNDTITGVENIIGSGFDDTLLGDAADNLIEGGAGDDLLNGRTGDDVLDGGAGVNTASFADQANGVSLTLQDAGDSTATTLTDTITLRNILNLVGSAHDDTLTGNSLDNTIEGGNGNDTLDGAGGTDDILTYQGQASGVTADLGAGTVAKASGSDNFSNFEHFAGTTHTDLILAGALINDMDGGDGADTLSYANIAGAVTVNIELGTTTGALTQTFANIENITGGTNNDLLTGDGNDNVITGGDGDDTLNPNGGNDTLNGGNGTDTATYVSYADAITVNLGNASLEVTDADGATSSLISIETLVGTGFEDTFNSGPNSRTIALDGGAGIDTVSFSTETNTVTADLSGTATGDFGTYTFVGGRIENLVGGSGNDILTGTSGDNVITGGGGNDTLNANGGNDTLDGGLGTDTATFASYGAAVTVDLHALTVTDAASDVVNLVSIETVVATDFDDTIRSGQVIVNTTINGGAGTDTLDFSQLQAAVTANLTTGTANIGLGTSYTLQNIENLIGGGLEDYLTGSAGDNIITGGGGNDRFYGSDGTDILDGGSGTDYYSYLTSFGNPITAQLGGADITLTDGGTMNTTLRNIEWIGGTSGADTFYSGATARNLTLDGYSGTDTINFSNETTAVTANLGSNAKGAFGTYTFVYGRIENIVGGSGNDTLTGTANGVLYNGVVSNGNNVIEGGDGDDFITGNAGNDTIDGGDGTDTANFAPVTGNTTVTLNSPTTTVAYTDALLNNSTSTLTNMEVILTGSGNDNYVVAGNGLNITLNANGGTDTINFTGQAGALVIDLGGVSTGAFGNYTLNNFENVLSGSGGDTITGTSGNNVISAGNGTDTVNAGDGNDIIVDAGNNFATNSANVLNGEGGNDTFYTYIAGNTIDGGADTDTLRYDTNSVGLGYTNISVGTNTSANLTFTLAADSSGGTVTDGTRTDTFTSIEIFYGSNGNDVFIGGSGNDTFNGNNGDDTFRGLGGNNTFNGGNGSDTADYSLAGSGVNANLTTNQASNGDGGTDTLNAIENLIGSTFNDTLTGNSSNNVLRGGDGDDMLVGSQGNDTLNGEGGDDTLTYASYNNALTINLNLSRITGLGTDDYLNVENIVTGGGSDIVNTSATTLFANTVNFDLGAGSNDRIVINSVSTVGTDATDFAQHFGGVEQLDFLLANTANGNMVIDGDDVFGMTTGSHQLRLDISAAFGLDVQNGSYTTLTSANLGGGVTQYYFSNGGATLATLDVHVV